MKALYRHSGSETDLTIWESPFGEQCKECTLSCRCPERYAKSLPFSRSIRHYVFFLLLVKLTCLLLFNSTKRYFAHLEGSE